MTNLEVAEMGWESTGAWGLVETQQEPKATDRTVQWRRETAEVPGDTSNLRGSLEPLVIYLGLLGGSTELFGNACPWLQGSKVFSGSHLRADWCTASLEGSALGLGCSLSR